MFQKFRFRIITGIRPFRTTLITVCKDTGMYKTYNVYNVSHLKKKLFIYYYGRYKPPYFILLLFVFIYYIHFDFISYFVIAYLFID